MSNSTITTTPENEAKTPAATAQNAHTNLHFKLIEMAGSSPSRFAYYANVLQAIAEAFASPYAAISVHEGSQVIEHDYKTPDVNVEFWKSGVQSILTEALGDHKSRAKMLDSSGGDVKIVLLAASLCTSSGTPIGAIALVTNRRSPSDAVQKLTFLESLTCVASCAINWTEESADKKAPPQNANTQALTRAGTCSTPEELAFTITNSLRNKLGCEQVALATVNRKRVKILAISGLDDVTKQSPVVLCQTAAMEECLDADVAIACPDIFDASKSAVSGYRLHQQWRSAVKGDAVVSIPLRIGDDTAAILSMRHREDRPLKEAQIEQIRSHVEPYVPVLRLLRDANRGPIRCTQDAIGATYKGITSRGHVGRKIAAVLFFAAAGWILFGTVSYDLTVSALVKPRHARQVTAPFEGVLREANALPGDLVKRGDILCQLDQRDAEQQMAELVAEVNVFESKLDQALADDDPVSYQLALSHQKLARAKLDSVNTRIDRCIVRAPLDGVVVAGDLRNRLGGVVQLGDLLYEVAPLNAMVLELEVPEADVDDLANDLTGVFASSARPRDTRPFRITRIHPRTEPRVTGNVCVVEANADLSTARLYPGMEGVARIHVGRRRVWWIGLHRVLDYLRLHLWI
jgi:HlyD family secretion protein